MNRLKTAFFAIALLTLAFQSNASDYKADYVAKVAEVACDTELEDLVANECLIVLETRDWLEIQSDGTFKARPNKKKGEVRTSILVSRPSLAKTLSSGDVISVPASGLNPVYKRDLISSLSSYVEMDEGKLAYVVYLQKTARYKKIK